MFDTYVTVIGNVLNMPEWRRTTNTGSLVASFKVASTARRLNKETGEWVDGNSLRVRVVCWRRLAEGVGSSVKTGDPVVVVGRLYTREWRDENDVSRLTYELEAVAVGHDLSKGRASFARVKPAKGTSMVEDAAAEARVGGELTEPVAPEDVPAAPPSEGDDVDADWPELSYEPLAALTPDGGGVSGDARLGGIGQFADNGLSAYRFGAPNDKDVSGDRESSDNDSGGSGSDSDGADDESGDGADPSPVGPDTDTGDSGRRRRGRKREPVPA